MPRRNQPEPSFRLKPENIRVVDQICVSITKETKQEYLRVLEGMGTTPGPFTRKLIHDFLAKQKLAS